MSPLHWLSRFCLFTLYILYRGSVWPHIRVSQRPCHSPKLTLLGGSWEGQEQQTNVDQDLIGFWADLGARSDGYRQILEWEHSCLLLCPPSPPR